MFLWKQSKIKQDTIPNKLTNKVSIVPASCRIWMRGMRGVRGFSCMLRLELARCTDDTDGATLAAWLAAAVNGAQVTGSFCVAVDDADTVACTPTPTDTEGDTPAAVNAW